MLFERYAEVVARLEELGARAGELNNRDRQVLQNLLEEQEWLSTTLVKRARYLLDEIDRNFEKLFDWMICFSDLTDRAASERGTPSDILGMEKMMREAVELREQLNRLLPGKGYRGAGEHEHIVKVNSENLPGPGGYPGTNQVASEVVFPTEIVVGSRCEAAPAGGTVSFDYKNDVSPNAKVQHGSRKNDGYAPNNKNKTKKSKYVPPRELIESLEQKMYAPFASRTSEWRTGDGIYF